MQGNLYTPLRFSLDLSHPPASQAHPGNEEAVPPSAPGPRRQGAERLWPGKLAQGQLPHLPRGDSYRPRPPHLRRVHDPSCPGYRPHRGGLFLVDRGVYPAPEPTNPRSAPKLDYEHRRPRHLLALYLSPRPRLAPLSPWRIAQGAQARTVRGAHGRQSGGCPETLHHAPGGWAPPAIRRARGVTGGRQPRVELPVVGRRQREGLPHAGRRPRLDRRGGAAPVALPLTVQGAGGGQGREQRVGPVEMTQKRHGPRVKDPTPGPVARVCQGAVGSGLASQR